MSPVPQPYNKPALSFGQQADRLINRGLVADKAKLTEFLGRINYYRFTAYLYPFRQPTTDDFKPGTEFTHIYMLYEFDQALRTLLFNAITVLEIAILRARFVEFFTLRYGPFGYNDPKNFTTTSVKHLELLGKIQNSFGKSKEEFIEHFRSKYSDKYLPLWMVAEIASFGEIMTMVNEMHPKEKTDFFKPYGVRNKFMDSWLRSLNYVRNCCAHHGRLWNRALAIKPLLPDKRERPDFNAIFFYNSRIFAVLTITQYLLNIIDPSHTWDKDLLDLLVRFPDVPTDQMGFLPNWQDLPMWKR